jgi:hypothetical protein
MNAPARRWIVLIVAAIAVAANPARARITVSRPNPSEAYNPVLPFTLGGGIEFTRDPDQKEWAFPLFLEYNLNERLQLNIETNGVYVEGRNADTRTVFGVDDLELGGQYEFLRERRYTPAVTLLGGIKFDSASDPDLGSPGTDYHLGVNFSKDFVKFDLDLTVDYVWSGDPETPDGFEIALACEYPLTHRLSVVAEIVQTLQTENGHFNTAGLDPDEIIGLGSIGNQNQTEATLGLSWHATNHLTLEDGVTWHDDGTWTFIFAWEWSFAGEY